MQNSMDWTHEQAIEELKKLCAVDRPDCIMIIALWNEGSRFDTRFLNVGMKVSEMVALLEVQKHKLLSMMEREHE